VERIEQLVNQNYLPARVHVKEDAAAFERLGKKYGAQWTPTVLFLDPGGVERHRIEGFLPANEFAAQLLLGLGHLAFQAEKFADAQRGFEDVLKEYPNSDAAAEAQYWAGVSRYKASGDAKSLAATAAAFESRYKDSVWAKKASVWRS
jgi:hypothetical protein